MPSGVVDDAREVVRGEGAAQFREARVESLGTFRCNTSRLEVTRAERGKVLPAVFLSGPGRFLWASSSVDTCTSSMDCNKGSQSLACWGLES